MSDKVSSTKNDTYSHIIKVQRYLIKIVINLTTRSVYHDQTKFTDPELKIFSKFRDGNKIEFGTTEYLLRLTELKEALDHHYMHNSHHPEHYKDGINDMTLMDLCEMLCDWMASSESSKNGDILHSLEICRNRFNIDNQLYNVLKNTILEIKRLTDL